MLCPRRPRLVRAFLRGRLALVAVVSSLQALLAESICGSLGAACTRAAEHDGLGCGTSRIQRVFLLAKSFGIAGGNGGKGARRDSCVRAAAGKDAIKPRQVQSSSVTFGEETRRALVACGKAQLQLGRRIGRSGMTKPAHGRLPSSLLYPSLALRCTPHNSPVPARPVLLPVDDPIHPSSLVSRPTSGCLAASYTLDVQTTSLQACRQGYFTLAPSKPIHLYTFPTNVGTPTCPAFWLRLSRLSLSTLFPEKIYVHHFG